MKLSFQLRDTRISIIIHYIIKLIFNPYFNKLKNDLLLK